MPSFLIWQTGSREASCWVTLGPGGGGGGLVPWTWLRAVLASPCSPEFPLPSSSGRGPSSLLPEASPLSTWGAATFPLVSLAPRLSQATAPVPPDFSGGPGPWSTKLGPGWATYVLSGIVLGLEVSVLLGPLPRGRLGPKRWGRPLGGLPRDQAPPPGTVPQPRGHPRWGVLTCGWMLASSFLKKP